MAHNLTTRCSVAIQVRRRDFLQWELLLGQRRRDTKVREPFW